MSSAKKATTGDPKTFKAEDYSRFLIREFLKKNNFNKTYDLFIEEDTRPKVTMTKNELTRLIGIESLMKRNQKSKVFNTMLDILCDFLMISKDVTNGVDYPKATTTSIMITESKNDGTPPRQNQMNNYGQAVQEQSNVYNNSRQLPPSAAAVVKMQRPQTSVPGNNSRTQSNFYNPGLQSKPAPMMNAFQAGSNADISQKNLEMDEQKQMNKNSSKPSLGTANGFMVQSNSHDMYGNSTEAATSKPVFDSSRESSGISGSIQHTSNKMLLNQPSADSFAQVETKGNFMKNQEDNDSDWEVKEDKDIDNESIPMNFGMLGITGNAPNIEDSAGSMALEGNSRPQTSHGRGRQAKGRAGIKKREVMHAGLGETSKDLPLNNIDDASQKQMMKEKEEVQITGSGFRRKQMKQMEDKSRTAPNVPRRAKPAPKNDDLDDLDDMMGGGDMGGLGGGFGGDDEDDFFGGGGKKFDDDDDFMGGGKKKKQDNSDPLAFLQRANDEKKQKAEQKALQEQENSAAWKKSSELNYNLISQFMENEDKGKQTLGNDLYKTTNLNVDPNMRSRISSQTTEQPITRDESNLVNTLLFKNGKGHLHDSWKQGFYFDEKLKYGIYQGQGGPCGILATVNAFFLKHLLFGNKMPLHYLDQKNFSGQIQNCLALAISDILYNSSNDSETNVTLVIPQGTVTAKNAPILPHQCTKIVVSTKNDYPMIYNLVKMYLSLFNCKDSQGVILLVYSCILTRGPNKIKDDMDLQDSTLLNEHGYASQELINLMLVGQAMSNVHDGDKDLGDDFILKGINKRSDIGFLTYFEYFGYFTVGENLKTPRVPIWIICSESHYSVIFSPDANNYKKVGVPLDLVYYDELARWEDDIILSVEPGKYTGPDCANNKNPVPLEEVIRTKWTKGKVCWNGRTKIL